MDSHYFWLIVCLLAIGTLAIRFSFISVSHKVAISNRTREIFTFIPAAILPALVGPMIYFHQGHVSWLMGKERLFILVLSSALFWFYRSMTTTLAFGLIALYVVTTL